MDRKESTTPRIPTFAERWERLELPAALALVAAGFLAIAVGWLDASATPDVRRQLQSFLSGGFGGLALVLLGASLLQARVASRIARAQEDKLDRVADALLDLALRERRDTATAGGADDTGEVVVTREVRVVATHAGFHLPQCDLVAGRDEVRELSWREAAEEGLRPCGVCLGVRAAR